MRENLIHVNSKNEKLDFYSLGVLVDDNDLRDYEWSVSSDNDSITGFSKGIVSKSIPLKFWCDSEKKASEIKNKFYEHFEVDVLGKQYGYFLINDYKLYCYLTKSVKSNYNKRKRYLELTITISTDKADWIKQTSNTINFNEYELSNDSLTYPFTYSFTYRGRNMVTIANDAFFESDIILRIYGDCVNPLITINDNVYQVNITLDDNEYIEINTKEKTIYKYSNYGVKTNVFEYRNKDYDVFKKIPSGNLNVSANANFKCDIEVIELRSEPKWV